MYDVVECDTCYCSVADEPEKCMHVQICLIPSSSRLRVMVMKYYILSTCFVDVIFYPIVHRREVLEHRLQIAVSVTSHVLTFSSMLMFCTELPSS